MSALLTPLAEYLTQTYNPDREYIDGVIEQRHLGEYAHARLAFVIAAWFGAREREWNIRVVPEQRLQVSPTRFRVPDIAIFHRDQPVEQIFTRPPLIAIGVLSPEDRLSKYFDRIHDYAAFGVPHIWIVDPRGPKAMIAAEGRIVEAENSRIEAGNGIYLSLTELDLDVA